MNKKVKKQKTNIFTASKVKSIISQADEDSSKKTAKIDLVPQNYTVSKFCPRGSLIKAKQALDEVMHIKKEAFESLAAGDAILVLHSLENKINHSHVLTFIHEESMYMYVCNDISKDFEILIKGSIGQERETDIGLHSMQNVEEKT